MTLPKRPNFKKYEPRLYRMWEGAGYFTPQISQDKEPYTILLPPPNANASLHMGHAMFVIEDILIRFNRMRGKAALWIPGTDHAGFETQFVFENKLAREGKSRFDFDRNTLYQKIYAFVLENSGIIQKQLRRLGFSLDWTREKFTLDEDVVETVLKTFQKMYADGLIYRDNYMVNYCPSYGTTFSDLEVKYIEKKDPLYYLKYGPLEIATVRPETKFGDTAVAVHPADQRYQKYLGKEIEVEGLTGRFKLKVIADEAVDPEFGTGVVKVTPAHDPVDFEIGKRHNLEIKRVIGLDGKLTEAAGPYAGMGVEEARRKVVEDLKRRNLITRIDYNYTHRVAVSYKGEKPIEPMLMPNWFVNAQALAKPAVEAVRSGKIKFIPARFEKDFYRWMEKIKPWAISRQIAFGIRIPAWYHVDENPQMIITFIDKNGQTHTGKVKELLAEFEFNEIEKGLQALYAPIEARFLISPKKPGARYLQETDVFDTWFSSGQWPLVALGYPNHPDFKYFYPTNVLDTMWDILFFWVARMIMFGLYLTGKVPFRVVYLHSMVTDEKGTKMSKSKGNVINPLDVVKEYGADVLRMSLVFGSAPGTQISVGESKFKGQRNFITKLWNIARFTLQHLDKHPLNYPNPRNRPHRPTRPPLLHPTDEAILKDLNQLIQEITLFLENFQFSQAAERLHDFTWNRFASDYLESAKLRLSIEDQENLDHQGLSPKESQEAALWTLQTVLLNCLKLLHPFIPFVTEEIYQQLPNRDAESIMVSEWPSKLT